MKKILMKLKLTRYKHLKRESRYYILFYDGTYDTADTQYELTQMLSEKYNNILGIFDNADKICIERTPIIETDAF